MKDQEHIRRRAAPRGRHAGAGAQRVPGAHPGRGGPPRAGPHRGRAAVPPPPNRATGAGDDSDEGWEESDEDDPVEDLIHRERIRERDLLRTPGCLALGRKAFRLEDMPRVTERDREILRRVLYILREAERHGPGPRRGPDQLGFHFIDPLAPVAEKEIVPRVRVFIPYLGIEGWISITSRGPALNDGHLIVELKYLQAMHAKNRMLKKCCYTLYLLELADRLRGEASRETLKTARKNVVELDMALLAPDAAGVIRKSRRRGPPLKALEAMSRKELDAELDARACKKGRMNNAISAAIRDLVRRLRAGAPAATIKATLVADGAKKVSFHYQNGKAKTGANGSEYLVERWRASLRRTRCASSSTSSRRVAAAAADELPVDRLQRVPDPGLVNLPTIWPRMRFSFRRDFGRRATEAFSRVQEALRSLENAFAEFMPVSIQEKHRISEVVVARIEEHNAERRGREAAAAAPRLERYKADFALQLKDLAYVEAADEAYLRDQAAALAPPEPMPDGSRPPIDAHSRRVARAGLATLERMIERRRTPREREAQAGRRVPVLTMIFVTRPPHADRRVHRRRRELLPRPRRPPRPLAPRRPPAAPPPSSYVVPNCEVVTPPPPPIYHVTENGERLVLYATRVQRR
ncbi:hypothetical protein JL720_13117 [Aureococcus anophagefferens]|nr:hypothetical protein JL720_13117 [Aureococcus anophagefferens]